MSPHTMNEEERRELIARQHKALYGDQSYYEKGAFNDDSQTPRPSNTSMAGNRGPSPMTYGSFGVSEAEDKTGPSPNQGSRSRTNSNSSPASNAQNFGSFDQSTTAQQSSRTSSSSPGGSPPRSAKGNAPAPIGTRPTQAVNPTLSKRNTPPAASPLSFGFAPNESSQGERTGSAASNPPATKENMGGSVNWGSGSGVWGKSSLGGVSSAVWG
jgi:hypothetical protein